MPSRKAPIRIAVPARPRPHHPFGRLPPAEVQDAGLRLSRGRPLPHAADPQPRSGADRPHHLPRAGAQRGSRRGAGARPRSRPHALRPCRRGRAGRGDEALSAASTTTTRRLRILTRLERRYAEFDGLNLTWETLEGTVKHNGPLLGAGRATPLPATIAEYVDAPRSGARDLARRRGAGRGAVRRHRLQQPRHRRRPARRAVRASTDLADVPLVGPVFAEVAARYPGLEEPRLIHEAIRRVIDRMVGDLVAETRRRLADARHRAASPRSARSARRWWLSPRR